MINDSSPRQTRDNSSEIEQIFRTRSQVGGSCFECEVGKYNDEGTDCTHCLPGLYDDDESAATPCSSCAVGRYSSFSRRFLDTMGGTVSNTLSSLGQAAGIVRQGRMIVAHRLMRQHDRAFLAFLAKSR